MKFRLRALVFTSALSFFNVGVTNAVSLATPSQDVIDTRSGNVVVFDATDEKIMYEKNADDVVAVASLTKIMTAMVVLENSEMSDEVTVTQEAVSNLGAYVTVGLSAGEKVSVEDLMYALLLPSAGDAAQALAIDVAGSIPEFSKMMNEKATEMGLSKTHFSNPVGMDREDYLELWGVDERNESTAREMLMILREALKDERFRKVFETNEWTMENGTKLEKTTVETAKEYGLDISPILGAKTGYTVEAGRCLASEGEIDGAEFLMVNIGTTIPYHLIDAVSLYDFYGENYGYREIAFEGEEVIGLEVIDARQKEYIVKMPEPIKVLMRKDRETEEIEIRYRGRSVVDRSIEFGEKIGEVEIVDTASGEVLYATEVKMEEEIKYYSYVAYVVLGVLMDVVFWGSWVVICKRGLQKSKR